MGNIIRFASENHVAQAVQNLKQEVDLTMPQILTEAQKNQIKENLGLSSDTQVQEKLEPVTTEYVYTYDGDNSSDSNVWVSNYGGTKVFVKMGKIPDFPRKILENQPLDSCMFRFPSVPPKAKGASL